MAVVQLDNGLISDDFEMGEHPYKFGCAIVLPADQYYALSESELHNLKLARYEAWYARVTAPPDPNEPVYVMSPEELALFEEGEV